MKYTVKQKRVNSRHRRSTRRSTKTQASLPSNSISTKVFAPGILPLAEDYSPVFAGAARSLFRHWNRCVFFFLPPLLYKNLSGFRSWRISQELSAMRRKHGQTLWQGKKKITEIKKGNRGNRC